MSGLIRARISEVQLALMLLTRLPAGRLADPAPAIAAAGWAFPLAGLALALPAALVLWLAMAAGIGAPVAVGLALATQIVLTGGLHEDGLADLCDGFWGGRDRARRLEIMRDSRIGSYGALGLILSVGLRWSALAALAAEGRGEIALIVAAMASRLAPLALMTALPPARADGMGHAAASVTPARLITALILGGAGLFLFEQGVAALMLAALTTCGLGLLARRKIGGQTGDVLGAAQQIAEIVVLIVLGAGI